MNARLVQRVAALILFCVLMFYIRGVILPIVLSLVLFYILHPLVKLLMKLVPGKFFLKKDLMIVVSFAVFVVAMVLALNFIIPPFISEFNQLTQSLPQFIIELESLIDSAQSAYFTAALPDEISSAVFQGLNSALMAVIRFIQQFVAGLIGVLGYFIGFIIIPVIAYYMLRDDNTLVDGAVKLVPADHKEFARRLIERVNGILEHYVEGQALICLTIGVLSGAGFYLLGVRFALILGMILAVAELVPVIGPVIGVTPALIVSYIQSPDLAAKAFIVHLGVQGLSMYVVAPRIMGKKLDLHPLTIVVSVLVLGSVIGVWGIFFAAPIMAVIKAIYVELKKT